jgi:hypothetical protein
MSKPTILLVPPTPDHPLLAPGRAGAMPPRMERCPCGEWFAPSGFLARRKHEPHYESDTSGAVDVVGLVLALAGSAEPDGMNRLGCAMVAHERVAHGRTGRGHGYGFKRSGVRPHGWWLSDHGGPSGISYGSTAFDEDAWVSEGRVPVLTVPALAGIPDGLPEDVAEAWALATIAAHRLGCEVVVVGEVDNGQA